MLETHINNLIKKKPFSIKKEIKYKIFLSTLKRLTNHHKKKNIYFNHLASHFSNKSKIEFFPYLGTDIFKHKELKSIKKKNVYKTLISSGTSGKQSKIFLDKTNSKRQQKILQIIGQDFLGKDRRPMLVIGEFDVKNRNKLSASNAAILGFSLFGKNIEFLNLSLKSTHKKFLTFCRKYKNQEIIIFGFTFEIWKFFKKFKFKKNILPPSSILLHGGGWKKMESKKVNEEKFKNFLNYFGLSKIINYYGTVEQIGSIFFQCEKKFFHCSNFSDIIIRNKNFDLCNFKEKGIIQLLSLLPTSYPGHSILTQDIGAIYGEDNCECGRKGKYFRVFGRIKDVEIRGCSDSK